MKNRRGEKALERVPSFIVPKTDDFMLVCLSACRRARSTAHRTTHINGSRRARGWKDEEGTVGRRCSRRFHVKVVERFIEGSWILSGCLPGVGLAKEKMQLYHVYISTVQADRKTQEKS